MKVKVSVKMQLEVDLKEYGTNTEELKEEIIEGLQREFGTDIKSIDVKVE